MQKTAITEHNPRTAEKKIAGITYVVTVDQGQNVSGTLKEKLRKLILQSARMKQELSGK